MKRIKKLTHAQFRELIRASEERGDEVVGTQGELFPEMFHHVMSAVRKVVSDYDKQEEVEWALRDLIDCLLDQGEPTPLELAVQRLEAALAPAERDDTGVTSSDRIYIELKRMSLRYTRDKDERLKILGSINLAMARIQSRYDKVDWDEVRAAYAEVERLLAELQADAPAS